MEAKEYRFKIGAEDFSAYADEVLSAVRQSAESGALEGASLELPNYEGVRVNFGRDHGNGWLLIRKSLHDPVMPVNIESDSPGGTGRILESLMGVLAPFGKLSL